MAKQRKYNPDESYAQRAINWVTDSLGITSAPTYKDGYGVTRYPEEGRWIGQKERLTRAIENTGDALMVGSVGAGLFTNPIATASTLSAGLLSGGAVNYVIDKATNGESRTFGKLIDPNNKVANYFRSQKIGDFVTEGANPGYLIGGYKGAKAGAWLSQFIKNPKATVAATILNRNVSKSLPPTVRPVYHATTYLGDNFNVVTKGGELGIHVGTDKSAPNYFLNNWKKLRRTGNPVIRTGYLIEYNGRIIDTPDLNSWNAETIYNHSLNKNSSLGKRVPSKELESARNMYNTAFRTPFELKNIPGNSTLDKQIAAYTEAGKTVLDKLGKYNIDGFRYRNAVENPGNISIAIFNPNRIFWSKEIFTDIPKQQMSSSDFSLLSKFGRPNMPSKFFKKRRIN